ncbi:MAG TPA: glycosyltransferase family 4 protein [Anaerolineales bacterium]|nr:glycosyltransferase family 4 protein [Anaerolineales bacterium]
MTAVDVRRPMVENSPPVASNPMDAPRRVLFLTQIVPYPPDAGPRVKTWYVLRYLYERGHRVTLATFVRPEERPHLPILADLCERVLPVPLRRSRLSDARDALRSLVSGRPFLVQRDDKAEMRALVREELASGRFDVVHADQLTMAQFALPEETNGNAFRVFDAHNATWTILRRSLDSVPPLARPLLAAEAARVRAFEGHVVRTFDHTLAVTSIDREALLHAAGDAAEGMPGRQGRVSVMPIAVDSDEYPKLDLAPEGEAILTLGTLHYAPNADGIRWFLRRVLPLVRQAVPGAQLTIVGRNPPADFRELAARMPGAIHLTGYVPDVTPYFAQAAVIVVPVLAGSGMRVRILEALARGRPLVTTSVGLEGIDAHDGEEVLVADEPEAFAAALIRLLRDRGLQQRLADRGRNLVEARYDWRTALRPLDRVYAAAGGRR